MRSFWHPWKTQGHDSVTQDLSFSEGCQTYFILCVNFGPCLAAAWRAGLRTRWDLTHVKLGSWNGQSFLLRTQVRSLAPHAPATHCFMRMTAGGQATIHLAINLDCELDHTRGHHLCLVFMMALESFISSQFPGLSCFLSFYFQMSKLKKTKNKTSPKCIVYLESSLSVFLYMNQMALFVGRKSEFNPSNHLRMTPFSRFSNWNVFIPGKNNTYFRELVWGFFTTYIKCIFQFEVLWVKFSPQTWVLDWIHF